jgi:hypothetical protein
MKQLADSQQLYKCRLLLIDISGCIGMLREELEQEETDWEYLFGVIIELDDRIKKTIDKTIP